MEDPCVVSIDMPDGQDKKNIVLRGPCLLPKALRKSNKKKVQSLFMVHFLLILSMRFLGESPCVGRWPFQVGQKRQDYEGLALCHEEAHWHFL